MSLIRGRGNKDTELTLMSILRSHRVTGWRRNASLSLKVPVSGLKVQTSRSTSPRPTAQRGEERKFRVCPDFVFSRLKLAVFVDGCFWHGCPLHGTKPRNNAAFWRKKLAGNKARDRLVTRTLRKSGWRVLRLWEHELSRRHQSRLLKRMEKALTGTSSPRSDERTRTQRMSLPLRGNQAFHKLH
jgi:DNA mismatch endonuclease, patch repair protein